MNQLVQELRKQYQVISELRAEIKSLQADNLKLYENVRYMQSYRQEAGSRPPVSQLDPLPAPPGQDDMSTYRTRYEEAMNPFEAFRGRVRESCIVSGFSVVLLGIRNLGANLLCHHHKAVEVSSPTSPSLWPDASETPESRQPFLVYDKLHSSLGDTVTCLFRSSFMVFCWLFFYIRQLTTLPNFHDATRAYQNLNPVERGVLVLTRSILGNRRARTFFVCYALFLHVLVMYSTYECTTTSGTQLHKSPRPYGA